MCHAPFISDYSHTSKCLLTTLQLSGTVYLLLFIHAIQDGTESDGEMIEEEQSIMHELMPM